jgi:hypothetical protein
MPILSPDDHAFFAENGYIIVPNAVPQQNLDAVIDAIWEFLGMDRNAPEDWYREPHRTNGMVEIYQHQALWDNRQAPRVYETFTEILGTAKLWVSMDRACMKPRPHPAHPKYDHKGFIHWDTDITQRPARFSVQGVLYLADTDIDQGGFQCAPSVYRETLEWIRTQPGDSKPPEAPDEAVIPIPGKAGDLLIWNSLLPHGNGHNISDKPRLAQYISMFPAPEAAEAKTHRRRYSIWDAEAERTERIACWQDTLVPKWARSLNYPHKESRANQPAKLTPLGRKLLGLDRWE